MARPWGSRLWWSATACAIVLLASLASSTPAVAQPFDIKELEFEKGEQSISSVNGFQSRLRGPDASTRSAHEVEWGRAVSDHWLMLAHVHADIGDDGRAHLTHVTLENVFKLVPLKKDGLGLGWFTSFEVGTAADQTNRVIFGPVISRSLGPMTATLNTFLDQTYGRNHEDGIALAYAWRTKLAVDKGVHVGLEGFGRIDNVGNAPPWSAQEHRIGPALMLEQPLAANRHIHFDVGLLFGMTEATPSRAIKLNVSYGFE